MKMKWTDTAAVRERLEGLKPRSAWGRGVREYAYELLDKIDEIGAELGDDDQITEEIVLNGSQDWAAYSYDGRSLIDNKQIAQRLCAPWELRRVMRFGGILCDPNRYELWTDVQARALFQAWQLIRMYN